MALGFATSVRRRSASGAPSVLPKNTPEARFCAQCAAPLDAAAPIRAEPEPRDGLTGERRHLTVLFCDLVNSTSIAAQLDPEEWREIVAEYHRAAASGHRTLWRACRAVPWRRCDGLFRLSRRPTTTMPSVLPAPAWRCSRPYRSSTSTPRTQSSRRGSALIQARWWLAPAPARIPMCLAILPMLRRGCRQRQLRARYW